MAVLTSEQDVEPFLNRETVVSDLPNLRKDELLLISDHFELNFTKASKKADILAAVQDLLGLSKKDEAEEVEGEADPGKPPTPVAEGLEESMQEVDEELEKLKLQLELGKLEAASRERELAFTSARDERNRQEREREYERQEREREYERQKEKEEREYERQKEKEER